MPEIESRSATCKASAQPTVLSPWPRENCIEQIVFPTCDLAFNDGHSCTLGMLETYRATLGYPLQPQLCLALFCSQEHWVALGASLRPLTSFQGKFLDCRFSMNRDRQPSLGLALASQEHKLRLLVTPSGHAGSGFFSHFAVPGV